MGKVFVQLWLIRWKMTFKRKGFILYIVLTVLLGLSILAMAFSAMKSGVVTQLARSIDQNRLVVIAQSASAEAFAMIRSSINHKSATPPGIFEELRSAFPDSGMPQLPRGVPKPLFSAFIPQETKAMAEAQGYDIAVKCKAVFTVDPRYESQYRSFKAYKGYIDLYSQAFIRGSEDNVIELHERREVKLIDFRHLFDKYALFVKNYGPDYNNTRKRLHVMGVNVDPPGISRVFMGNNHYPDCDDPHKNIWLDLYYQEHKNLPGFSRLFGTTALTMFPGAGASPCLFHLKEREFNRFSGISVEQFYFVPTVMNLYETFVNQAANAVLGDRPFASADSLSNKAREAMANTNENSAAYKICADFANNANGNDYSACEGFDIILRTCINKWQYHFGYTDAASVWNIDNAERPDLPSPKSWATALAYGGLASKTAGVGRYGQYFDEYVDGGGKNYNPERFRVGKMPKLYGPANNRPVLIEGPVFLRFFKLAYLNDFVETIDFLAGTRDINPEPVPMMFQRDGRDSSFLNTDLNENLAPNDFYTDRTLMSRAIDDASINVLLGDSISYVDAEGNAKTINPLTDPAPTFSRPDQPSTANVPTENFVRLIDKRFVTRHYANPQSFLAERAPRTGSGRTLYIDGLMFIEKGDLDLSDISQFYGKGMIYLMQGNCVISNLARLRDPVASGDSLRIYLRAGSYIVAAGVDEVEIEASLAAFYFPWNSPDFAKQGKMIFNNQSRVTIVGNLLVDYFDTQGKNSPGLKDGGRIEIVHDPLIYDPAEAGPQDPYHASLSPVKSLYAISAGGLTF